MKLSSLSHFWFRSETTLDRFGVKRVSAKTVIAIHVGALMIALVGLTMIGFALWSAGSALMDFVM